MHYILYGDKFQNKKRKLNDLSWIILEAEQIARGDWAHM